MGVVDFTKAHGLVKHYQSLGICKIYYPHFIFVVMYHCMKNLSSVDHITVSFLVANPVAFIIYDKNKIKLLKGRPFNEETE